MFLYFMYFYNGAYFTKINDECFKCSARCLSELSI